MYFQPTYNENDVQPHILKPLGCWSQSDVCKWIIQYSEVVNGIIRGEQTFKLSVYQARWEDTGFVFVNALLIPLELSHPFTQGSGRGALNLPVCMIKNQHKTFGGNLWEIVCCSFCLFLSSSLIVKPSHGALPKKERKKKFKSVFCKHLINTLQWSLMEIPTFICLSLCLHVYFSAHTYQLLLGFLTFQSFARSCPGAQRDLLASFACKVERATLWAWGASRQPLPCGLPDWASQQPSIFPTCWGGAWQHSAQHLKVLSISPLPDWGQPFEKQQVGKDKHDPFTKTPPQPDRQKAKTRY